MEGLDVAAILVENNPGVRRDLVEMAADALRLYHEAAENVSRNGAIVAHPRTGAPMANPYLAVMDRQQAILGRDPLRRVNCATALVALRSNGCGQVVR